MKNCKFLFTFSMFSFFVFRFSFSQTPVDSLSSKDSSAVPTASVFDSTLFKKFHWTKKSEAVFEITVAYYDSMKTGNTDFQNFYYRSYDKPKCKMIVADENKNKVRECFYNGDKMTEDKWWFADGKKDFEGKWSETLNEYGEQILVEYTWYYRSGKIRKHGFADGVTTVYYDNGKPESEKTFRNGKAWGVFKEYYPSGKIMREGEYYDGNKSGEWRMYNEDGTLKETTH